jgi:hypothetical protein
MPQVINNNNVIVGGIDNMILFIVFTVRIVMFFGGVGKGTS